MVKELSLAGLKLITLKIYHDERGFFVERYQQTRMQEYGLPSQFIQDNHSRSKPGVIRGLHFQHNPGQGKLVGVLRGRVLDVAIDIRKDSLTYGKWEAVELSDLNGQILWIPPGFAHGFCVLGDEPADVMYKVDSPYSPGNEGGIHYADPSLNITWPIASPIVSEKDKALGSFLDYQKNPVF